MSELVQERGQTLPGLYASHAGKVSDKWSIYISEYGRLFQGLRTLPLRLLEIGVQNGGSLELWARFFPKAEKIVGCDVNPACAGLEFEDPRIVVVIGDAGTERTRSRVLEHSKSFEVVIDDGSHRSGDIIKTFARFFPSLSEGGVFIAEDLHCSYWKEFEGGLHYPLSSIAFFKCLADVINKEHWGIDKAPSELLLGFCRRYGVLVDDGTLMQIHSVEFINSMCVVHKRRPEGNVLGPRVVAGAVEQVTQGHLPKHGTLALPNNQLHNEWSVGASPLQDEAEVSALDERDRELTELRGAAMVRDERLYSRGLLLAEKEQELQAALQNRLAQVAEWQARVAAQDAEINAFRLAQTTSELRAAAAEQALSTCGQTIQTLRDDLRRRDQEIECLNAVVSRRDESLRELTLKLAKCEGELLGSQLTQGRQGRHVDALHRSIAQRDSQLTALHAAATESEQSLAVLRRTVAHRETQIQATQRSFIEAQQLVERLNARCQSDREQIDQLWRQSLQQSERAAELHLAIAMRDRQLAEAQHSLALIAAGRWRNRVKRFFSSAKAAR